MTRGQRAQARALGRVGRLLTDGKQLGSARRKQGGIAREVSTN